MKTLALLIAGCLCATAQTKVVTIAEKTAGLTRSNGLFPFYWDEKNGKLLLEIPTFSQQFLYIASLPAGLGSNDIGLDRGLMGPGRIVEFQRIGPKVLLVEPNLAYRAISENPYERQAVAQSFASSTLYGFTVEAEENGRVLVDATNFYLRDVLRIPERVQNMKQGNFHLDGARSAFYPDRTRNFPQNTEVEVTLTFAVDNPGQFVRDVTPSADAVTLREHHSFVQLPDNDYHARDYDPNSGSFSVEYRDYSQPISERVDKRLLVRHRLRKKDPSAALSEPVRPIRYYIDRGAPEAIRNALLEGARWWNQAFEAAGYKNAFIVDLLPEGADPMDVRYNLVQWVHRSTRGWSYGNAITDPRTGEIIKGIVTLGSLRVRQDYMIAEGLLAPYEQGKPVDPRLEQLGLARLRQLSAHEIGHTLGLQHNFAASTRGRASVMDYPAPLVEVAASGAPSIQNAYATGIGDWDKVAITYAYQDFPKGTDEKKALAGVLANAHKRGMIFITDEDSRPQGGAHPESHLWDNGKNAVDELNRVMQVRAAALKRFSERNIREGEPMSQLADTLVPLYLWHRYLVEGASKVLGGLDYTYSTRGDGQIVTAAIPGAEQRRALAALLTTITPEALMLPEPLLREIPPPAPGYGRTRESFPSRTGLTFDPLSAAETAAALTLGQILHPERAARLEQYHARDASQPDLTEVIDRVIAATWEAPRQAGLAGEIQRRVEHIVVVELMMLVQSENGSPEASAVAFAKLQQIQQWLNGKSSNDADLKQRAHAAYHAALLKSFLEDPKKATIPKLLPAPPGQPI